MTTDEDILYQLNLEAHEMGLQYLGTDPAELAHLIEAMRRSRKGKPPCFLRSFSALDKLCRQCDWHDLCGEKTIIPVAVMRERELVPCDMCDGDFLIDLFDERGAVVDRACSTPGCRNTQVQQERRGAKS